LQSKLKTRIQLFGDERPDKPIGLFKEIEIDAKQQLTWQKE